MESKSGTGKDLKEILSNFDSGESGTPIFWIDKNPSSELYIEYSYSRGIGEFYMNDECGFITIPIYIVKKIIN